MDWKISMPLFAILLSGLHVTVAGEHVPVDGPLIEASPGHKGFELKDDADGEGKTGLIFSIVSVNWRSGIRREGYMLNGLSSGQTGEWVAKEEGLSSSV
ncbi:MAG: hypothetical protein AABZ17_10215 [Nitrospirota bacterium]